MRLGIQHLIQNVKSFPDNEAGYCSLCCDKDDPACAPPAQHDGSKHASILPSVRPSVGPSVHHSIHSIPSIRASIHPCMQPASQPARNACMHALRQTETGRLTGMRTNIPIHACTSTQKHLIYLLLTTRCLQRAKGCVRRRGLATLALDMVTVDGHTLETNPILAFVPARDRARGAGPVPARPKSRQCNTVHHGVPLVTVAISCGALTNTLIHT